MRKTGIFFLMVFCAIAMAGCGAPATNTANTNTNANTAKPTAAAPTTDALLALEKAAQEAYAKADTKHFETLLSDKAVMSMDKNRMGKAGIIGDIIGKAKCEGVETKLSEPQLSKIDNDTYAFTYKNDSTGKCNEGPGGKMVDLKPTRASTIWVRNGDKWQAVWHAENVIMGASAGEKTDDAAKEESKDETKPASKAAEPKKDDKAAGNSNTAAAPEPAKLTPSANTDALTKTHAAGWEAFRNKDAKWFEDHMASTFAFVDPAGTYFGNKADTIKEWTGGGNMKCEGITKTSFTEGFAQAISPTVEMLFGKGNADGKCNGQANGDLWTTAVYVKEGDAWKLAYMFESLPRSGM